MTSTSEEPPEVNLDQMALYMEQTVMLLDQSFNAVSYQRRVLALSAIMADSKKAKQTIHDQASGQDLFGNQIREHVIDTAKVKKDSK